MSEQGLAARALAALAPSRRRAAAERPVRTVADLVRDRAEAAARAAAEAPEAGAGSDAAGPAGSWPGDSPSGAPAPETDASPAVAPGAVPRVLAESRPVARSAFAQAPVRRLAPPVPSEAVTAPRVIAVVRPPAPPAAGSNAARPTEAPTVPTIPLSVAWPADTPDPAPVRTDACETPADPTAAAQDEPAPAQPPTAEAGTPADAAPAGLADAAPAGLADAAAPAPAQPAADEPAPAAADVGTLAGDTPADPGETVPARSRDAVPAPAAAVAKPYAVPTPAVPTQLDARPDAGPDAGPAAGPDAVPDAGPTRAAVPALLSDADLMEALGEEEPDEAAEPQVVAMTRAASARPPTPPVRAGSLAPPWVRAALMGAEPRSSATPEQAAATRALRRTFGVPQDPGPVTLAGVDAPTALAVLPAGARTTVRPVPRPTARSVPRTIVGAPVPVRYRVVRRDGAVVAGADVALVDPEGGTVADGLSGPDGCGRFVVQQPGQYMLVGAAPGYQPGAVAVNAVAGTVDADVLLVRSASVRGVVRLDGEPVPAAQITLVQDGEVVELAETGPSGQFRITDLIGGDYALAVAADTCPPAVMVLTVPEEADLAYDVDLASPPGP